MQRYCESLERLYAWAKGTVNGKLLAEKRLSWDFVERKHVAANRCLSHGNDLLAASECIRSWFRHDGSDSDSN